MGCKNGKQKETLLDRDHLKANNSPIFMNVYTIDSTTYGFSGVLNADSKFFYLVFLKKDEDKLPLAVNFELSDDAFIVSQYQFLSQCQENPETGLVTHQFEDTQVTAYYRCEVSPSFPFPVDIKGIVKIKNDSE